VFHSGTAEPNFLQYVMMDADRLLFFHVNMWALFYNAILASLIVTDCVHYVSCGMSRIALDLELVAKRTERLRGPSSLS